MKFVFNKPIVSEGIDILKRAGVQEKDIFVANDNNPANYLDKLQEADAFVVRAPMEMFTAEMIEGCRNLKVIARSGVGYDMIDVRKASELGIPVVITPGTNARSVAEHAAAMMFALSKNIVEAHNETLKGNWNIRDKNKTFELSGKTAGIVGTGAIGSETADLCAALGMKIIKCNTKSTRSEFEYMLRNSDIISLHVPLNDRTRGMISEQEFSMMKPTAILINCARGGVVDEASLIKALNNDLIAGAGLDVFSHEPPDMNDEILKCKNLIVSPHSAALARESAVRTAEMCINGCLAVLKGEKFPHVADFSVYEKWDTLVK